MKASLKIIIPDTNIYLHCQPFDQIDRAGECGAKKVILLVPHVIVGELNKNKDQNPRQHLRERAGKSIKLLKKHSGGDEEVAQLSGRTFIEFLPWNREFDFQSHGLDAACADDKILAVALRLREERPDAEVSISTDDINLELKAKSFRIAVLYLLEELKIPPKLDADRKHIQQLEKQIREMHYRLRSFASNSPANLGYATDVLSTLWKLPIGETRRKVFENFRSILAFG